MTPLEHMANAVHRTLTAHGQDYEVEPLTDMGGAFSITIYTNEGHEFQLTMSEIISRSKQPRCCWGPWGPEGRPPSPDQLAD